MSLTSAETVIVAVTSDHHSGSSVALAPDQPVPMDDGQEIRPSKAQVWLWEGWRTFWDEVARRREAMKAALVVVHNGDLVDGPGHHGTLQSMHNHPGVEAWIAKRVLAEPQELGPDATFVIRGTESHVGQSGKTEEALAEGLKAVKDPQRDTFSWWHARMELQGLYLSFTHHGRTGYRPWTKPNAHNLLAADIFMQHAMNGERHPDIAFRSHFHQYGESARHAFPVQVIQTPAWQLHTSFATRVVPESLSDVGGVICTITDGRYTIDPILYRPQRGAIWKP